MSIRKRITNLAAGLVMLLCAGLLLFLPDDGYLIVIAILALSFVAYGIKDIIYYITMARFMNGGRLILYKGIISLDIGMLVGSLSDNAKNYIMFYLLAGYFLAGVIHVLRSFEAKKLKAPGWRINLLRGGGDLILGVVCLLFLNSITTLVFVYGMSLAYSAVVKIITSFKKTAMVYIQ